MKWASPKTSALGKGGESAKTPASLFVIRYSLFILFIICGFSFFYRGRDENLENFWEILGKLGNFFLVVLEKG
jgi:hypothetical protein